MGYNPHARRKILKELEQYGPIRDSSGRAINLLMVRMHKHGLATNSKQSALAQLVSKMASEGILELNRSGTRTYGIKLVPSIDNLKLEMVSELPSMDKPKAEIKSFEPSVTNEVADLKRQVFDLKSQLNAKDAVIAGLRRENQRLERNLETILNNNRVGHDSRMEYRDLMTTPPGHDRYRS